MPSTIWYLAYVEKPLADIIQNIHDFFRSYRKVRVNRNTIAPPMKMGGLAIMNIEMQWEAIYCSILTKVIKEKKSKQNMD